MTDQYTGFADRYDAFSGRLGLGRPEIRQFFGNLLSKYQDPRVLDCACGTGRDLLLFNSLGAEVVGSDLSPSMLKQAEMALAEHGIPAPLHELDYRKLPSAFTEEFDAVFCLSTSIAEMPDDDEALRALRSMHGVLRSEGILVLDQGTTDRQWREKPRFILGVNTSELTRLFVIDYTGERDATYNVIDVDHTMEQAQALATWSTKLHLLLRDDQERLLIAAGFKSVEFYGDYTATPYGKETSRRLIAVAKK